MKEEDIGKNNCQAILDKCNHVVTTKKPWLRKSVSIEILRKRKRVYRNSRKAKTWLFSMDTENRFVNNNGSRLEVHAISASSFEQEPIDLRNFKKIVDERSALPAALKKHQKNSTVVYDKPEYVRDVDKHLEVLKSAKSLFSKRTLTLYHWMYPNIPKHQLKASVASAWENLPITEKHFYISQVLGKFGYPQTSLMLNPQLHNLSACPSNNAPGTIPTVTSTMSTACIFPQHPCTQTISCLQSQPIPKLLEDQMKHQQTGMLTPATTNGDMGKSGNRLINAETRSVLLPQHQRINNNPSTEQLKFNFSEPVYEGAQFLEMVSDHTDGHAGKAALYEIRLSDGGGTCMVNDRMGTITGMIRTENNSVIINEDRYLENILVPISMAMRGQNSNKSRRGTTRGNMITKRRGRPPTLRKRPVTQEMGEQCVVVEVGDEFPDDPELRKELEQFENALNMQI